MAKAKTDEKTTYLLIMDRGRQQKITVPSHWKVTFGQVQQGSKGGYDNNNKRQELCLRLYDGTLQKAVFVGVTEFRDMSIGVEEKVETVKQETLTKQTAEGVKNFVVEAKVSEWRNPDEPRSADPEFLKLPVSLLPDA